MAFLSLRRKILLALLATTVVFAVIMVVFAETVVRDRLTAMLRDKGVAIARRVGEDCVSPVITERYFEVQMMFKDLQKTERDVVYAFVLGGDGRELVQSFPGPVPPGLVGANPVAPLQEVSARTLQTERGPVLDIAVPLLRGEAGVLRLGLSETPINRDVNRFVLLILALAAISLLLGSVVAAVVAQFVTRPLVSLAEAAAAFGRGEGGRPPVPVESEDEIGELAKVFNLMVENRRRTTQEKEQLIRELRGALNEVKTLRGIIPICSACKRIRSDEGSWQQVESYIREHSDADFSHGICPECMQRLYPEHFAKMRKEAGK